MPRTIVDIEASVLKKVKALQKKEGLPMGELVSGLLAEALGRRRSAARRRPFCWISHPMKALVNVVDKEAVQAVFDRERE